MKFDHTNEDQGGARREPESKSGADDLNNHVYKRFVSLNVPDIFIFDLYCCYCAKILYLSCIK